MNPPVVRVGVIGAGFVGGALLQLLGDTSRTVALVDAATTTIEVVGVARDVNESPAPAEPVEHLLRRVRLVLGGDMVVRQIGGSAQVGIGNGAAVMAKFAVAPQDVLGDGATQLVTMCR